MDNFEFSVDVTRELAGSHFANYSCPFPAFGIGDALVFVGQITEIKVQKWHAHSHLFAHEIITIMGLKHWVKWERELFIAPIHDKFCRSRINNTLAANKNNTKLESVYQWTEWQDANYNAIIWPFSVLRKSSAAKRTMVASFPYN